MITTAENYNNNNHHNLIIMFLQWMYNIMHILHCLEEQNHGSPYKKKKSLLKESTSIKQMSSSDSGSNDDC